MLKIRIMPCLLFDGSAIIKTINFKEKRTLGNPIQFARVYNARNVDELVFIDITATKEGRGQLFDVVEKVSKQCFMPLSMGGGIQDIETIKKLLQIGADKVIINSAFVTHPGLVEKAVSKFGSQCIVVSVDVKKESDGTYGVYIHNGSLKVSDNVMAYMKQVESQGAGEIFVTSIDMDGKMEGYDINLLKHASEAVAVPVVASGGAGTPGHVLDVIRDTSIHAASMASIFHYTQYTPNDVKRALDENGFSVRRVV